jgi:predicted phage terminase large subunit-like protein
MALIGRYVPADAPWLPDLRAELLAFPTGRHDDQVDALGPLRAGLCAQEVGS